VNSPVSFGLLSGRLPDKSRFIKDNEPFNVDFLNKPSKAAVCDVPLCDVLDRRVGK
jgi:hypothetical protein